MAERTFPVLRAGRALGRAVLRTLSRSISWGQAPTNWREPNSTPDRIAYEIDYGISNGELHLYRLREMGLTVRDTRVLEIGPGIAFGGMAYLLAAGAKVHVADRWLAPWFDAFHIPIYSGIADRLEGRGEFDVRPLRKMIAERGYSPGTIEQVFASAEKLSRSGVGGFDALFSNAVLEHVEKIDASFAAFFRLTRPGGVGFHQVDFRDHRDFERPLEHLLAPARFDALNRRCYFEHGSRRRQVDYASSFTQAGFLIDRYQSTQAAPEAYVDSVIERLSQSSIPIPANWTRPVLADIGGLFWVRRP